MILRDHVLQYLIDDKEGMKQLITRFLNEVMKQEAIQQTGARRYGRTHSRLAYRNGVRKRSLRTRYGDLALERPVLRGVPFQTRVFERHSRIERSLESVILESWHLQCQLAVVYR